MGNSDIKNHVIKYAPIVIPTLNRFEHFKKCFESLEKCTGSCYTDVYVALDYPPSEKYIDGWKKIDNYLKYRELDNAFHKLYVVRRDTNLGVLKQGSNAQSIVDYVKKRHKCYILTEDDNIFSPNFIEYINKGLVKYENDNSVFAIIGYCHPYKFKYKNNNHFRHNTDMSAWGYATWNDRIDSLDYFVNNSGFRMCLNFYNIYKVSKHGLNRLYDYINLIKKREYISLTDNVITIYLILNNKFVIIPTISKVRNIGWDESGCSFKNGLNPKLAKIAERHNNQIIDTNTHFDFIGDDTTFMQYNNDVAVKESDGRLTFIQFIKKLIVAVIKMKRYCL